MTGGERPCCAARRTAAAQPAPALPASRGGTDAAGPFIDLPGGRFLMGTDDAEGFPGDGEGPVRAVEVAPFSIAAHPITNAQFARFADAAGYTTEAERWGSAFVFLGHLPPARRAALGAGRVAGTPWWALVDGACWRHPEGPGSDLAARADHPVVQVSWHDAQAFCAWAGARLPTEAEWEYAARGGLVQQRYAWGDDFTPGGRWMCNTWQGRFPEYDTGEDGFAGTSPVGAYPPNGYGLFDVAGNVWEWCADRFAPRDDARAMRGGSFLCHASYCNRYRVAARSSNTPDSATANIGFRVVRS
ncbi:formylglycine-generating enzyme family protein [Xylophilus sp.]|uniref:formylglycine-generating enzyme family protein n=1 Tax=Xylophilus sp. TaxID=2653893 RepID=UPI0013B6329C|nr:formylglycine-generating enzyme family protein [Xylophilus sp.]KAF1048216.1 MAG: Serine/threonine-protein kinase pkn1 [Xylophilus sp.]